MIGEEYPLRIGNIRFRCKCSYYWDTLNKFIDSFEKWLCPNCGQLHNLLMRDGGKKNEDRR